MIQRIQLFTALALLSATGILAQSSLSTQLERDYGAEFSTVESPTTAAGYSFFRLPPGQSLPLPGNTVQEKAAAFWTNFGGVFGVTDPSNLRLSNTKADNFGGTHLVYQQLIGGYEVFGGDLVLHFSRVGELNSAGGFFVRSQVQAAGSTAMIPNPNLPAFPASPYSTAAIRDAARKLLRKDHPNVQWDMAADHTLLLAEPLFTPDRSGGLHWAYAINLVQTGVGPLEYTLYFSLEDGRFLQKIQAHCDALNRTVYDGTVSPANLEWQEGDPFPGSLTTAQRNLVTATGETYNLFFHTFGRDGYNGNGGTMNNVNNSTQLSCPNASAGSTTTFYCNGTTADDVIAHEWAHVYTRNINGLIYAWESGALNEAFSDIFGEVVDLLNNTGTDTNHDQIRTSCNQTNNVRWKLGEDATAFSTNLRDLWQPECRNDPSHKSSSEFVCGTSDNGGVHTNSGVLNRSFSLLVDGGTLEGITVTGIGLTKATHIYHQAWANYLTRVTDYFAVADALLQAADDLLGVNLIELTVDDTAPGLSNEIITAADIVQLTNVIAATEMQMTGPCTPNPALDPDAPEICPPVNEVFVAAFAEDWENGMDAWTVVEVPSNPGTWDPKPWELDDNLPDGRPGFGVTAPNPFVGNCGTDLENGYVDLISPTITLPEEGRDFFLTFDHYFSIEQSYDGGLLYIIINGAPEAYIPGSAFNFNPYNIDLIVSGNDNPMRGQRSFSGSDGNSTSGSWGQSQVDFGDLGLTSGDEIQLIWRMSHDGCNGWLGWSVDNIEVGYCIESLLPVNYTSLTATGLEKTISVDWSTADEAENAGFTVERRSETERNFSAVGWVPAGLSSAANYQFVDEEVLPGLDYFYRLRQLDFDGTENLSPIVSARITGGDPKLRVFPNPITTNQVTVNWADATTRPVQVYRPDGSLVWQWTDISSGTTLTLPDFPAGIYFLRAGTETVKVLLR